MNPLHLLPPPIHRLAYRAAHQARGLWYSRTKRTVYGCTVLARDEAGRFLLVRHSYGQAVWTFPSGGIGKHETPLVAAMREFREELDCDLSGVKRLARLNECFFGATNVVHVFTGIIEGQPRPDRREIVEARFFEREDFPAALSRNVAGRMEAFDRMQDQPPAWHKLQQR